jgi:hypothetical protein
LIGYHHRVVSPALISTHKKGARKLEYILYGFAVLFLFIWVSQYIQLMRLTDDNFPYNYDKALWFQPFILLNLIGCGLSNWWKHAYLLELKLAKQSI